MFCVHCGNSLKEGSRFCSACGAPVVDTEPSSSDIEEPASGFGSIAETKSEQSSQGAFASQMESDRERSRRKLSPLLIVAIVLALLAGTALAAVLITQQANQGEETVGQAQSNEEAKPQLTVEEQVIKSLDGWWQIGRAWKQDHYLYFHDGTVDVYSNEGKFQKTSRTIVPDDLMRADEGLGASHFGGPGYFIRGTDGSDYGFYLADETPDALHQVKSDGSGYSGGDSYGRVDPPSWAASIGTESTETDSGAFDQSKAEAEARAAAEAAGKTVLTGTIAIGTEADWAAKKGLPGPANPGSSFTYVGLILDEPVTVSAHNADGERVREEPFVERSGEYVLLGSNFQSNAVDLWAPYDGQRVSVAFSDFTSFSDSLGVYFSFKGSGERIAPLAEADVSLNAGANGTEGDYVLADSSTRRYSRDELEKMDLRTLFLARNEIFARHGGGFKKQELRDWFGSKPWYSETIPAGTYGKEFLNDIERDNVELMKAIEQERNSPYLN